MAVEDVAQRHDPAPAGVALQRGAQLLGIDEVVLVGSVDRGFEAPAAEQRREVEQGASHRRDRHAVDLRALGRFDLSPVDAHAWSLVSGSGRHGYLDPAVIGTSDPV